MNQSAALFGRQTNALVPRNLVQFKAGKMTITPDKWVYADPRKGWAYLYQDGEGKLHFCWIDRRTGYVEENYTVVHKQAKLEKVTQCSTGRVYVLKLKSNKKLFLWMQERHSTADEDLCTKVNSYINSPPSLQPSDWLGNLGGLNRLTQSDIMALLSVGSGAGGGLSADSDIASVQATPSAVDRHLNTSRLEPAPVQASASSSAVEKGKAKKINLTDLHNILKSINASEGASGSSNRRSNIDLNDVLNVKVLKEFVEKPEIQSRLTPHLPVSSEDSTPANSLSAITVNLQSSQFKSTLKSFTTALRMGALTPVVSQFNFGAKVTEAAKAGDVIAFAKALQLGASSTETKDDTKPDEPEKMDQD